MKNTKKYLPFIIFIFLCMLIYAKFGIINVKAETYYLDKNSSWIFENDTNYGDYSLFNEKSYNQNNKYNAWSLGFNYKDLIIDYDNRGWNNYLSYVSYHFLHFKYYYDIEKENNFSFIRCLNDGVACQSYISNFEIYDSKIYTSMDDDGVTVYNEFIIIKETYPNTSLMNPKGSFTVSPPPYNWFNYFYIKSDYDSINYFNNSSFTIIDSFITNENILPTSIVDYISTQDIQYFSPDELKYEDEEDNSIFGYIKRIWYKILAIGRGILTFPDTIKNIISSGISSLTLLIADKFNELFIPQEGFLDVIYQEVKLLFEQKFGILIFPATVLTNLFNRFGQLANSDVNNFVINVPEFTIPGFDVPIINATSYNLSNVLNHGSIHTLWVLYLDFIDVFMIISVLNLSWNKLNSVIGGQVVDTEYYTSTDLTSYDNLTGNVKSFTKNITHTRSRGYSKWRKQKL